MYSITTFLVGLDEKGEKCVGAKLSEGNRQTAPGPNYSILYLASSKGLTFCNVQGVSKKRYFSDFCLISVLEVVFYFFRYVFESEF